MKNPKWTTALFLLLAADSAITVYIGAEASGLTLWVMGALRIDLATAMVLRLIYALPLLYIVDRYYNPKIVILAYVVLYFFGSASVILFGML